LIKLLHITQQSGRDIAQYWLEKRYDRLIGLILSMTLLIAVWIALENYYDKKAENNFHHIADEHSDTIRMRLHNYIHILRSGTGLFYSSDTVGREEWHRFVEVIDPSKYYPGLQGIGFSLMLRNGEEGPLRKRLQEEGFTPYTLENTSTLNSAILYLEPLDTRNRNAIGYDMYAEPIRRAAMKRAAATGEMSISGKVTLVQEIDKNIQAGFLIYLPVFTASKESNISKSLRGYVYSPIRADDYFTSIPTHQNALFFKVYDNNQLLYQSIPLHAFQPQYHYVKSFTIGGRIWTIHYYSSEIFEQTYSNILPIIVAIAITLFNLLLLSIIIELVRKRLELKKKTKEIEETTIWLNRLLNFSADGIHILDKSGNLVGYSPSFRTMLGYNESEMESLTVFAWDDKFDPEIIKVMMDDLTENMITFESIFRRKDGSIFDVEVKAHTFYEEGEKFIFASSWNITEQKRAKQELQCEKEMAQHYLDIVEVMILVIGTDNRIQLINRKGSEILGYTFEEAIGKNFIDLFIPERMREQLQNVADGLLSYDGNEYYENPIITKNGIERLIAWRNRPMHGTNGTVNAILTSGEDITDIRRSQKDLMERESFYKTIFASVSDAIVILENYFVIDCNENAMKIFETDFENFVGKYVFHIAYDIECQDYSFLEHVNRAYEGYPLATECSIRIHAYDSEPKIVELMLTSFGKSQDNKLIMVIRDITHKLEEQRFLTMNARQAQMGEMISMIAHQWRQPLAIINAITSQIRMKAMLSEDEDIALINSLIKIEQQSAHLSQTISDYRDFFRPDKPIESILLSDLVNHSLELIDHTVKSQGVTVRCCIHHLIYVEIYRNELIQVIISLLKNSFDAFEENAITNRIIQIDIDHDDRYGILIITDNGGGINKEILDKVFVPYFTTKNQSLGTGLGLYMSKLIIEDHCQGELNISSNNDETTITLKLPYTNL